MHLRLIEIENFRGIKNLALKLDVITAVFGEGSFGKSSLIEALKICLGPDQDLNPPTFSSQDFHLPPGQDEPQAGELSITLTFREGTPQEWASNAYRELAPVINKWRDGRREVCVRFAAERESGESRCQFLKPDRTRIVNVDVPRALARLRSLCPVIALSWHGNEATGAANGSSRSASNHLAAAGSKRNDMTVCESSTNSITEMDPETAPAKSHLSDGDRYILSVYRKALSQPDRLTREELAAALEALSGLEGRYPATESGRIEKYQVLINEIREASTRLPTSKDRRTRLSRFGDVHQVIALLAIVGTILEARGTLEMPQSTEPIIAFENLETNLHPIARACIWDLLAQIPVQKLMISNSDDLLASVPLRSLRRVVRRKEGLKVHAVASDSLTKDDIRRLGYHIRLNRADAIMNRVWLLIEGESEGWLLPEMAHVLGYDFKSEGIRCIEFAQCGIEPMIKMAQDLGIEWHLLSDGDNAGHSYVNIARRFLNGDEFNMRISCMKEHDIEHHLAKHGFLKVYANAAGPQIRRNDPLHAIVRAAVKRNSKPALILKVIEYAQETGMSTVSPLLGHVVETCIKLARTIEPDFAILTPKDYES
jgi:putative ATP-dependent endonuclease of OLD family